MEQGNKALISLEEGEMMKQTLQPPKNQKKPRINKEEYTELLNVVIAKFPNCFSVEEPKPLKLGIRQELQSKLREAGYIVGSNKIHGFMRNYCTKRAYILSHKEGAPRIDLYGNIVGEVSKDQAESIKKLLPKPSSTGFKKKRGKFIHRNVHKSEDK